MASDSIKITPDLDIKFDDLMRQVDFNCEFKLMDVLRAAMSSSEIPVPIMGAIVHCKYIEDFWKEAQSRPFEDDGDIEYLELSFGGSVFDDEKRYGKLEMSGFWGFDGVGKRGVIPQDLIDNDIPIEDEENYRQGFAVEFSPIWKLSGYPVRISRRMTIERYGKSKRSLWGFIRDMVAGRLGREYFTEPQKVDYAPSLTLIEVLYYIFWELSYCGDPSERDTERAYIRKVSEDYDKAKADGTLKTISHEEIRKRFKEKDENEAKIGDDAVR